MEDIILKQLNAVHSVAKSTKIKTDLLQVEFADIRKDLKLLAERVT